VQSAHQLGNVGAVGAILAGHHDIGVGRIGTFDEQGILGGVELGFDCVVGVDQSQVDISQCAGSKGASSSLNFSFLGFLTTSRAVGSGSWDP
jgi:hypothetical protein